MSTGRLNLSRLVRVGDGSTVGVTVATPCGGRLALSRSVRVWGAPAPIYDQTLTGTPFVYVPPAGDWYPVWFSPLTWIPAGPPFLLTNANPAGGDNGAEIVDASSLPSWPTASIFVQADVSAPFSGWPSCTAYLMLNGTAVDSTTVTLASLEYHHFTFSWAGTVAAGDVFAVKYSPWPDPFSNASASVSIAVSY